jgi:insecticidal toxin complex protein TccC
LLNPSDGRLTEKVMDEGFDANGNLCALQAGQLLVWDLRNQLREIRPVVREEAEDDRECYVYDGNGQRMRKVRTWLTNARSITSEVRYLPGVEIRTHGGTGEILHVITASAGSNSVQVLHWASKPPNEIAQDQVRYSLNDHLKCSALELDQQANVISWEWYYAFGGTARWAGRNAIEAKYKTVRYSDKERDATGLYYYGFRYYAPWLQRWINPDPAGDLDGLNRYRMLSNNPLAYFDPDGLGITSAEELTRIENFKVNIDNQISFYMPDRVERIYSSAGRKERMQFIEENLDHEPIGAHGIYTSGKSENTDEFLNDFYRDMWIFKANRRDPKNETYFATDIYLYQFMVKSRQKKDISGHLPSVIKRENVHNGVTLKKTEKLKSGSDKLLATFLNETPNGKSTQRLLNEIGMKATAVERFEDGDSSYPDFIIHVVPDLTQANDVSSQPVITPLTATPFPQSARIRPRSLLSRIFQPNRSSTRVTDREQTQ